MQQPICLAKALVDSMPNTYDKDTLRFKVKIRNSFRLGFNRELILVLHFYGQQKGDIIEVISMNASGVWRGRCHGRLGFFKFINVEVMPEQRCRNNLNTINSRNTNNGGPVSVEDLLVRIGLKEYTSVFVLNG